MWVEVRGRLSAGTGRALTAPFTILTVRHTPSRHFTATTLKPQQVYYYLVALMGVNWLVILGSK